jgi:TonB family protein
MQHPFQCPRVCRIVTTTLISITLSAAIAHAQEQVHNPAPSDAQAPSPSGNSVELITPTAGVDFSRYTAKMSSDLKKHWFAVMPEPALKGDKGKTVVRFQIQRDGKIKSISLEESSGKDSLDQAALKAVLDSSPLDPLPSTFKGPYIALRFIFLYNMSTSQASAFDCDAPTADTANLPPFDRLELRAFLAAQTDVPYAVRVICQRGINFSPDSFFLDALRLDGVSPKLVDGLAKIKPQTIAQPSPDRVSAYGLLDLALADKRKRQLESADEDYRRALQLAGDSATLHLAYARNLIVTQNYLEAEAQARRSLELWAEDAEAHVSLAMALSVQKRDSEAVPEAREALRIFPDHKGATFELGASLARSGQYKEAVPVLRDTISWATQLPVIYKFLGSSLLQTGNFDEAIEELNLFLNKNPNDAEAHYFLGVALREKGKPDDALVQFREAAHLEPTNAVYSAVANPTNPAEPANAAAKPAGPQPDDCFLAGNVYTNTFFGFSYEFPKGWIVQHADAARASARLGVSMLANGDPTAQDMAEAAASKAHELLYVTKETAKDISTSISSIHITAVDRHYGPGVRSGEDFLKQVVTFLKQRASAASIPAPPEQFVIAGRTFWKLRLDYPNKALVAHLVEVVTIEKNYVLLFVFGSPDAAKIADLVGTIQSIRFTEPPPPAKTNETDDLARQLMDNLSEDDKKGVLVLDLESSQGQSLLFGPWLSDRLSSALASQDPQVQVIDRTRLAAELGAQHISSIDEHILKNAISLSKAVGATTVVFGTYGAAENGIGMSLRAFRVSELDVPHSTKFEIGRVFGKIPFTQEVSAHLSVPLDSLRPKDGVYRAGVGGVSVPSCVKCNPPLNMHVPDIDLQGLLRDKRNGGSIMLRFVVAVDGHATFVTVAQPIGYGVDDKYLDAAKAWEFKPAVDADNKPVPALWELTFYFNFK